jgi:hypothetical protein
LYAAVKDGYDTPSQTKVGLLVRRPAGLWDDMYPVTANEGTRPIVLLNETTGKLKVVYTTHEAGGDILYRESSTSNIAFSRPYTLIGGNPSLVYNYATSSHQSYSSDIVIMATDMTNGPSILQAVSLLAIDAGGTVTTVSSSARNAEQKTVTEVPLARAELMVYPNPIRKNAIVNFTLHEDEDFIVTLYNSAGEKVSELGRGIAIANKPYTLKIDGTKLVSGLYIVQLQTKKVRKSLNVIFRR